MNWSELLSRERFGDKKKNVPSAIRSEFEVDFDRIVFSQPFRRLQDKTQVFPLPELDFVHTRLTHSLEVSSVGRSLGKNVGAAIIEQHPELKDISAFDFGAITGAASLAHDVGNPPFGHSGEEAISDFFISNPKSTKIKDSVSTKEWADLTSFEGNAQGFRLLIRNNLQGLNVTKATLGAFTKYPRPSLISSRDKRRKSQKKYGFFQSESEEFEELANTLDLVKLSPKENIWCRHPLAFLVEAADDICYNIIDLEDGFGLGLVSYEQTEAFLAAILQDRFKPEKLKELPGDKEKIGVLRAVAIQVLVEQVTKTFIENEEALLSGEFDKALTNRIPANEALDEISSFSVENIYRSRQVLEKEAAGCEVIGGLLESFVEAVFLKYHSKESFSYKHESIYRLLPDYTKFKLEQGEQSVYQNILTVTDFISGLTDSTALSIFRTIKGIAFQGSRRG
ncbi:MAG: deoxyguanosinetriphosphate triphosphohydrolase [Cyclobacteriaceae bacterium]